MSRSFPLAWTAAALLLATALLGAPNTARAAPLGARPPLDLSIQPASSRVRTNAPFEVELRFLYRGTAVLQGRLDLAFYDGQALLGRWVSEDLAVVAPGQSQRVLLPASAAGTSNAHIDVRPTFVSDGVRWDLAVLPMFAGESRQRRTFVVAVSDPWGGAGGRLGPLLQTLRVERFDPDKSDGSRTAVTGTASINPAKLPTQPLGYCPYDVVVLASEAFASASDKQLAALRTWVRGGGSLLVLPLTAVDQAQANFLNDLASDNGAVHRYVRNGQGVVVDTTAGYGGIARVRAGLGRLVVATHLPVSDTPAAVPDWTNAICFLWKMRSDQTRTCLTEGAWSAKPEGDDKSVFRDARSPVSPPGAADLPLSLASDGSMAGGPELLTTLLPNRVGMLPYWGILAILIGFVAMIGPGDYFFLGWLGRRRFTWLLFPAVTVAVTLLIVAVTQTRLGTKDQRARMVIRDLGPGGAVLRETRLDLLFAGRELTIETPAAHELVSPVGSYQLGDYGQYAYGRPGIDYDAFTAGAATTYEGRLPGRFVVRQLVRQWKPQVNRSLTFEPAEARPPSTLIDWDNVEPATIGTDPRWREALPAPGAGGAKRGIFAITGKHLVCLAGNDWGDLTRRNEAAAQQQRIWSNVYDDENTGSLLFQTAVRLRRGLFTVVSQVSPTGDAALEDLPVLDPSDKESVMLLAVERRGDDLLIDRRVYRTDGPASVVGGDESAAPSEGERPSGAAGESGEE